VTVALRGTRWRHRLSLQTPQHNETIDVFYIKRLPHSHSQFCAGYHGGSLFVSNVVIICTPRAGNSGFW